MWKLKLERCLVQGHVVSGGTNCVTAGSGSDISMESGFGGSDLDPLGLQEGREGTRTGRCAGCLTYIVPGNPVRL